MKKLKPYITKGNIIRLVVFILVIVSSIVLRLEPLHEYTVFYDAPHCSYDNVEFTSDVCQTCGKTYEENAVIHKLGSYEDPIVATTIYPTYQSYKNVVLKIRILSYSIILGLFFLIVSLLWLNRYGVLRDKEVVKPRRSNPTKKKKRKK